MIWSSQDVKRYATNRTHFGGEARMRCFTIGSVAFEEQLSQCSDEGFAHISTVPVVLIYTGFTSLIQGGSLTLLQK